MWITKLFSTLKISFFCQILFVVFTRSVLTVVNKVWFAVDACPAQKNNSRKFPNKKPFSHQRLFDNSDRNSKLIKLDNCTELTHRLFNNSQIISSYKKKANKLWTIVHMLRLLYHRGNIWDENSSRQCSDVFCEELLSIHGIRRWRQQWKLYESKSKSHPP